MNMFAENVRGWLYVVAFVVILALIVVDVLQGGDPRQWVMWLVGIIGLGSTGLAAKNTSRKS